MSQAKPTLAEPAKPGPGDLIESESGENQSAQIAAAQDCSVKPWYLYLIETANGALYTGITTDVERRFAQHVNGKGARALRGKGPLTLRHAQIVGSQSDALKLEASIKRLTADAKRQWLSRQPLSSFCHHNVISPGR